MPKNRIVQIFVPADIEATYEQVTDKEGLRRYCAKHRKTLPGDIELEVETAEDGGWLVTICEAPNASD